METRCLLSLGGQTPQCSSRHRPSFQPLRHLWRTLLSASRQNVKRHLCGLQTEYNVNVEVIFIFLLITATKVGSEHYSTAFLWLHFDGPTHVKAAHKIYEKPRRPCRTRVDSKQMVVRLDNRKICISFITIQHIA